MIVQSISHAGSGVSQSATLAAAPRPGNVVVVVANSDATLTITGDTWFAHGPGVVAGQGLYFWSRRIKASDSGTTTYTVTPSVTDYAALTVFELDNTNSFDVLGPVTTTASVLTATASTLSTHGLIGDTVLMVAAIHGWTSDFDPSSPVWGNGFAAAASVFSTDLDATSPKAGHFIGVKEVTAPGAVGTTNVTWSAPAGLDVAAIQIAFSRQLRPVAAYSFDNQLTGTIYRVSLAERVGITDSLAANGEFAYSVLLTDRVGISDSIHLSGTAPQGETYAVTLTESIGITDDSTSPQFTETQTVLTERLGILDALTATAGRLPINYNATVTDRLGMHDSLTAVLSFPVTITEIYGTALDVSRNGATGVKVTARLVAPFGEGWDDENSDVIKSVSTLTDSHGDWQLELTPTEDFPADVYYDISIGLSLVYPIDVPTSTTPRSMQSCLIDRPGEAGDGSGGVTGGLTIGTVTTSAPGSAAQASITGSPPKLNLTLPRGSQGPDGGDGEPGQPGSPGAAGPPNSLSIGTVTVGSIPSATITGTAPSQVLNLVMPTAGAGTDFYEHAQGVPGTTWTVTHNLGYYPNVSVILSDGSLVWGSVTHLDTDSLTIEFAEQFAGTATCS